MAFQRQENDTTQNSTSLEIKKELDSVEENHTRPNWMTEIYSLNTEILENIKKEESFDDDTKTHHDLLKTIIQEKPHSLRSGNWSLAFQTILCIKIALSKGQGIR